MRSFSGILASLTGYTSLDLGELERTRGERLEALLQHSYEKVPYYRRLFGTLGLRGGSQAAASFGSIPPIGRREILANLGDLIASDHASRGSFWNRTGGSTGEPLRFMQDRRYGRLSKAVAYDQQTWTGYRFGEPCLRLWGDQRQTLEGRGDPATRLKRWVLNITFLNAFAMGREDMRRFIAVIAKVRPRLVIAYAQSIFDLCGFAQEEGLRIEGVGAVMTSAGTLFPHMRERIERVCGAKVFDRYASREVSSIAGECEKGHLHVSPGVLVEVLDPSGKPCPPGIEGEVVVTGLFNLAMPLVRYRIGDRGSLAEGPCPCGRSSPLMGSVSGRLTDSFRLRDGGLVFPGIFNHLLFEHDWVTRFRIVQKGFDDLEIGIEALEDPPRGELEAIEREVRKVMGPDCRVRWDLREHLPPSPSGKYRYYINEMDEAGKAP